MPDQFIQGRSKILIELPQTLGTEPQLDLQLLQNKGINIVLMLPVRLCNLPVDLNIKGLRLL